MQQLVKEIFKDYKEENSITESEIVSINLYKKTNKLELKIKSKEKVLIEDLEKFESYLKQRFNIEYTVIKIEYEQAIDFSIKDEWIGIVNYMAKTYPISKAFLSNSKLEEDEKNIHVYLAVKGADILKARNLDKILVNLLFNVYSQKKQIVFYDKVLEESRKEYEDVMKNAEIEAIKNAKADARKRAKEIQIQKKEEAKLKAEKKAKEEQSNNAVSQDTISQNLEVEEETPLIYGRNINIKEELVKVADISVDTDKLCLDGEVISSDSREIKNGKVIVMFDLYDGTSTITCKAFVEGDKAKNVLSRIQGAKGIRIGGVAKYDQFAKEITVMANTIVETQGRKKVKRMDDLGEKRVELHMHTQMSQMDGLTSVTDLLKRAVSWGWKSIAITDHGVVQAFPEAHKFLGKTGADLKVIYGVEAYLAPDKNPCVFNDRGQELDIEYAVLDIETTGLSFRTEKITEIGIIKIKNGKEISRFECFVNPEKPIPEEVVNITHITDDMVKDAETIDKVMPKMLDFLGDSVIVAHNAGFDVGFLKYNAELLGYKLDNTYIDTLKLARDLFPDFKKYKLGLIAEKLGIKVEVAHRATDDVITLIKVFNVMMEMLKEKNVERLRDIDPAVAGEINVKNLETYHAIILAKDYVGLKNLYKLISYSHLNYFYKKPKIPKSVYMKYSEGLIIGSACEAGELYRAIVARKIR